MSEERKNIYLKTVSEGIRVKSQKKLRIIH